MATKSLRFLAFGIFFSILSVPFLGVKRWKKNWTTFSQLCKKLGLGISFQWHCKIWTIVLWLNQCWKTVIHLDMYNSSPFGNHQVKQVKVRQGGQVRNRVVFMFKFALQRMYPIPDSNSVPTQNLLHGSKFDFKKIIKDLDSKLSFDFTFMIDSLTIYFRVPPLSSYR